MGRILDRYIHRKALDRWRRAAQHAPGAAQADLRLQRDEARSLRAHLDRLIQLADARLLRPKIGSKQFPKPVDTDWSCRPDLWRGPLARPGVASAPRRTDLDAQVKLFHDCPIAEITIRQTRNRDTGDLAPFSLAVEVFSFEGSFLSVSVDLPAEAVLNLTREHLIRMQTVIECERHTSMFARLNIQHGPNSEQVLRQLPPSQAPSTVDFDLAHLPLNERRIEKIWVDLIFESPTMNRMVVRDLTFCRFHRADL
ncbi:DUF6478 family protein [Ruegeria sp. 6PALISEP08]|uniref:DUF6478 family protein n=1 Tax=Ruegeria sp. 6PALISEP08 TaxID=1225660 RepID=UPI00067E958B|nr:DUF6478 family protein [Ruegeria sp. 6PALISEP08]